MRQVRLPCAEPHSRFTTLFERLAIDMLARAPWPPRAGLLRNSWNRARHLMDRAVARGAWPPNRAVTAAQLGGI